VAELIASGLSTKDAASAAFLSPKSVEAKLGRVYRKLGVRNRAELGALIARQGRPGDD
jgi:DNA-binding CsgD family transcriptional regulator